jgi:hypothetical protein
MIFKGFVVLTQNSGAYTHKNLNLVCCCNIIAYYYPNDLDFFFSHSCLEDPLSSCLNLASSRFFSRLVSLSSMEVMFCLSSLEHQLLFYSVFQ